MVIMDQSEFKQKKARQDWRAIVARAATYSPGCDPSTIGAAGLNFSVRDGKRWDPCAGPPNFFWYQELSISYQITVLILLSYVLVLMSMSVLNCLARITTERLLLS